MKNRALTSFALISSLMAPTLAQAELSIIEKLYVQAVVGGKAVLEDFTEINGVPLPPRFLTAITMLNRDGVGIGRSFAPDNPFSPTRINQFPIQGNWKADAVNPDGSVELIYAHKAVFEDPEGNFVPGGECAVGCSEITISRFVLSPDPSVITSADATALVADVFTDELIPVPPITFKINYRLVNVVDENAARFDEAGVPLP